MQVTCGCGKVLNVPETLAGKTARCPACKKVLQMPGAAPAAPVPSRIMVTCSCGKKLAAPVSAAGKKVLCPKCNQEMTVPAPAKLTPSAPVIKPMPPPASYAAAPAEPRKPAPAPTEDLMFDVEPPPPAALKPRDMPEDSPGGVAEKAEYGLGKPKCPNCKADLAHGAQFCVECGTSLATGNKVNSAAKPAAKKKGVQVDGELVKKILVGLLLAAAVAIGGYSAYKHLYVPWSLTHSSAPPPAPAPAVQPPQK
jgi:hypothetical protein